MSFTELSANSFVFHLLWIFCPVLESSLPPSLRAALRKSLDRFGHACIYHLLCVILIHTENMVKRKIHLSVPSRGSDEHVQMTLFGEFLSKMTS